MADLFDSEGAWHDRRQHVGENSVRLFARGSRPNGAPPAEEWAATPPAFMTSVPCATASNAPAFLRTFDYSSPGVMKRAKAVCATCPVIAECLSFALNAEGSTPAAHRFGVVGGTTPSERFALSLDLGATG